MNRYSTLIEIVKELQPKHVVEIGTWNGKRAASFMGATDCYYTGFDLFEEASKETDEKEFNVKQHFELTEVAQQLDVMGFSKYMLTRGDTNKTLWEADVAAFDFCFIDGGHSEETIRNDFLWAIENIAEGGTIILDDYYNPRIEGMGCNFIVDAHTLLADEYDAEVLPQKDGLAGGGTVSLVRVET